MNRVIKFRGLDNVKWLYGCYAHNMSDDGEYHAIISQNPECKDEMLNQQVTKGTTGQFTGLKDKNGVEIYEGDIWARDSFTATVEFENSGWALVMAPSSLSYQYPYFCSNAQLGEVIGNIHENPELLEVN